jgi:hypothetical protein
MTLPVLSPLSPALLLLLLPPPLPDETLEVTGGRFEISELCEMKLVIDVEDCEAKGALN